MKVQKLHNQAIEIADIAFIKKFHGKIDEAILLFAQAFELEKEAAYIAKNEKIGEPTISILLKSAASLAMNSEKYKEAEKLICLALYGEPPHEIADELRNLLEELYFQRHLELQGVSLNQTELQLVIAGKGIGYGMVKSDLIFDKVSTFEKLTIRTVERKLGKPFRVKGNTAKVIKLNYQPYLSVPRAASFAFTIRMGAIKDQMKLEGFDNSVEVIDDIVNNIDLVNNAEYEKLKTIIPDDTYYKNFIGLSKELAPDGEEVNLVGLSIIRDGQQKDVQFTRTRSEITSTNLERVVLQENNNNNIELVGRLSAADDDENNIRLKIKDGKYLLRNLPGLGLEGIPERIFTS
ncbi:MAG: hypothetical protein EOP45_14705 [Sphingobacteriaceae bacterium]|nr:MAG: hypothetical protein EOP45_14705 [Sphingobacteriaceae bacterium]